MSAAPGRPKQANTPSGVRLDERRRLRVDERLPNRPDMQVRPWTRWSYSAIGGLH